MYSWLLELHFITMKIDCLTDLAKPDMAKMLIEKQMFV
jgi:hypothetical protein